MAEKKITIEEKHSLKFLLAYNSGQFIDQGAYQAFTFLIFNFYYTVVIKDVFPITLGFIIWSLWNSINDPLLGALSDRTKSKWGRRKPYIVVATVPLCLMMIFLWTPPTGNIGASFAYFLVMICLFDTIYTMYSVNSVSLFPELFQNLEERAKSQMIRQIFTVISLVFATILPTFLIPHINISGQPTEVYLSEYILNGVVLAISFGLVGIIYLKFGLKEREEFSEDHKAAPPLLTSLKYSLKNPAFRVHVIAMLCTWYVYGMLPTIVPLYGRFVLGIEENAFELGLLLGFTFISAAIFTVLWRFVSVKLGVKRTIIISNCTFIILLIPFMFVTDVISAFIAFFLAGVGLAGSMVLGDLIISAVVDADELETGIRREGGYYGINGLIIRFGTIFIFVTISIVLTGVGWKVFDPETVTEQTIFGLRSLMCIFPAIALGIGAIVMSRFPISHEKYKENREKIEKIHEEKRKKLATTSK